MEDVLKTNEWRWDRAHPVACMDGRSPQQAWETRGPPALEDRHATGEGITVELDNLNAEAQGALPAVFRPARA